MRMDYPTEPEAYIHEIHAVVQQIGIATSDEMCRDVLTRCLDTQCDVDHSIGKRIAAHSA